jgi:hypothetical protein
MIQEFNRPTKIYPPNIEKLARVPGPLLLGGVRVLDRVSDSNRLPPIVRGIALLVADDLQSASLHKKGYWGGE